LIAPVSWGRELGGRARSDMTEQADFQRRVRERMADTGESYAAPASTCWPNVPTTTCSYGRCISPTEIAP
jgi:hypothetical protein